MPVVGTQRRRAASALVLLAAAAGGCASRAPAPVPLVVASGPVGQEAALARDAVTAFVALEARGDEAADTLLAPGADFVATGIVVTNRPRLAGMVGRGEGAVEEARTELAGSLAWVVVVYRWTGRTPQSTQRGRATLVLERRPAGWRIRHGHSSTVERW